jgi:hypothetical protein
MLSKFNFFKKSSEDTLDKTINNADEVCKKIINEQLLHLGIDSEYRYSTKEAVEELGLDDGLVHQLVEDYVIQIIKSTLQFEIYLEQLQLSKTLNEELDFTPLRELAHKNLGVARNLRIKNAEILLYELMKKDDLDYLEVCLEALKVCSVKLKPKCAYNTLKLIKVKNSL